MANLRIIDILERGEIGQPVTAHGWVRSRRDSKAVTFLVIGDGSSLKTLQAVVDPGIPVIDAEGQAVDGGLAHVGTGASVSVAGELVASLGKGQAVELKATRVTVLGLADQESYPLQKKGHSMEFLRSIAHLRSRSNVFGAVFRIRAALAQATHRFFSGRGFHYVHTPIITASDCEGAGAMFEVRATTHAATPAEAAKAGHFFGKPAMLTVSGQLNAEALAYGLGRVYTFGPTFRAENSNTNRHLAEFWMIEPEAAFFDIHDDMDLAEAYLQALIDTVFAERGDDVELLNQFVDKDLVKTLETTRSSTFVRLTYTEAVEILLKSGKAFEFPVAWGADLQSEHERFLTEEHFKQPVILTGYPKDIKSFYMFQNPDGKTVAAMDVLVPRIGEIIGGSQREPRLPRLEARITELGMKLEDYTWYLDLNRFGAVPHAGFGLGFERAVMFCTGMVNIRDVVPFPRAVGQAAF